MSDDEKKKSVSVECTVVVTKALVARADDLYHEVNDHLLRLIAAFVSYGTLNAREVRDGTCNVPFTRRAVHTRS